MFGPIKKLRKAVHDFRTYDPEMAYISQATDMVDLERRQREVDAGKFRQKYYY
ncbi:hypothetical protein HDIA_0927 [Hartmannibacter diazotrophicus]|uniref:DUF3563 domain-containing protein n=1 Tax=Hartmannibacter diazotrophicus TaxID=1482074 RepID=A0A2C9D2T6_9HYPH|nr:DUF3563 family protein [Hartmannibacter diazotrophicus]SON54468.1 hypothetical protein HDIA_0927 [Hartmannibacter diazotrophicus]